MSVKGLWQNIKLQGIDDELNNGLSLSPQQDK